MTETSGAITALNFFGAGGVATSNKNHPLAPVDNLQKGDLLKPVAFSQEYSLFATAV
jgi:hypothetical protein